jgi:uncharacterized SAM-binding protein YcdF (DUF218 family)
MFIVLSKLLPILLYPLSLVSFLLIAALLLKRHRRSRQLILIALALLWLGANRYVAGEVVQSLEWRYLPPAEIPPVEAIVILGGGTSAAEYPRSTVEVSGAGDRVIYGARLYRDGAAPLVVVTGGLLPWSDSESSGADSMTEFLLFLGVPPEAILVERESDNTYENAVFTKALLEEMGINRILLVTSAIHMPRSVLVFQKQGFEVIPAPTDYQATISSVQKPFSETWPDLILGLFPNADNLNELTSALKEYLGLAVYRLRGWL